MRANGRRISDPVHGVVVLTQAESRVIDSQAFQRLRNIKQLSLAHYVYPDLTYSRFSHCVGACHIMGRMLETVSAAWDGGLRPEQLAEHRMAALLHDIGHYPFSHTMERVLEDKYNTEAVLGVDGGADDSSFLHHEHVGKLILEKDKELEAILKDEEFDPTSVAGIFGRTKAEDPLMNMISSDLDADRVDYLLRTSHHSGLPFGSVDLNHLISNFSLDKKPRVCLHPRAMRSAEHFLLSRYYDYSQVAYHKTVVAFDLLLQACLRELIDEGKIKASAKDIEKLVTSGEWSRFDDYEVIKLLRQLARDSKDRITEQIAKSLIERHPPCLIYEFEQIVPRSEAQSPEKTQLLLARARELNAAWARRFKIPKKLWFPWRLDPWPISRVGGKVPIEDESDEAEIQQSIRILQQGTKESRPIVGLKQSLLSVLSEYCRVLFRLYVLIPGDTEERRAKIREQVRRDLES